MLTRAQMVALDRHTIDDIGIPALVLMEVAGRRVADVAQDLYNEDGRPVVALAGPGNNGADAVVAARHLHERGVPVAVALIGRSEALTDDAATQIAIADRLGVPVAFHEGPGAAETVAEVLGPAGTVIDGLFGTGLSRPVEGWPAQVMEQVRLDDQRVVAVDIPSGVDADSGQVLGRALAADTTVTFQFPKMGHVIYPGRGLTGALTIADIGIPPSRLPNVECRTYIISTARLREAFPFRDPDSHKGRFGHLLAVAGAPERPGSALLVGRAALRVGTGLVTIGSDRETVARLAPAFEALMGQSLGLHRPEADAMIAALETRSALAIGPSLAPDPRTLATLKTVLLATPLPAVVDAGALSAMADDFGWLRDRPGPTVLTPHPGEMARLAGLTSVAVQADRVRVALDAAQACGAHVVLKGASTVVAHPDGSAGVVVAGNAGLASAGTGDVLTGVVGGLLAQGVGAGIAAEAAALLHAMAGDRAAEVHGEAGLTAPDVLIQLAEVVRRQVEAPEAER